MNHSTSCSSAPLSPFLGDNIAELKQKFNHCSDIIFRHITLSGNVQGSIIYISAIVDTELLDNYVLKPLLEKVTVQPDKVTIEFIEQHIMPSGQTAVLEELDAAETAMLEGNAVLFLDGSSLALSIGVKGCKRRGVEEPATEAVVRGPREGFTENLETNLGLLRLKIKSSNLKTRSYTIGKQTKTKVILAYMDNLADPSVIDEASKRLEAINIDGVLESGYIEEFIEDQPYSPFPQLHYTERPDTVSAQLLEGRFAVLTDGTPFALMGPVTFWQMLQASEDYYERFYIGSLLRWLRYLFLFLALYLPAIYIAVTTFHQDMFPTSLLLSVAAARETIPFPALVEALIMEISFEALREAGIRLPKTVGQAVSILGALVIGQAAVQAGIVSAPMVIIVSLTGIASFTIPRFNFAISIRMLRFPLMLLAGMFGLFGIMFGTVLIAAHLCTLKSFGVNYMSGLAPLHTSDLKDILMRLTWRSMRTRPGSISRSNLERQNKGELEQSHDNPKAKSN